MDDRLRGLAAFLTAFEAPGFEFGRWAPPKTVDGVMELGYYTLTETAEAFIQSAYDLGWVVDGFDWMVWAQTPEGRALHDDREALANATPDQLARLLTAVIRMDRFSDGALADSYDSGLITAILRRAAVLASQSS